MTQTVRKERLQDKMLQDDALRNDLLGDLEHGLHDLCQPLTTLQCRLELGQICGDADSLRDAVEGGLGEMVRVFEAVAVIREHLGRLTEASAERDERSAWE